MASAFVVGAAVTSEEGAGVFVAPPPPARPLLPDAVGSEVLGEKAGMVVGAFVEVLEMVGVVAALVGSVVKVGATSGEDFGVGVMVGVIALFVGLVEGMIVGAVAVVGAAAIVGVEALLGVAAEGARGETSPHCCGSVTQCARKISEQHL
jgi:hypothetical protein